MTRDYSKPMMVILSKKGAKKIRYSLLHRKPYDATSAIKEAKKMLQEQGFTVK